MTDHSVIGAMTESSNVVPSAEAVAPADQPLAQDTCVHADNSKSSKGRVIRRSSKTDYGKHKMIALPLLACFGSSLPVSLLSSS